MTLSEWADAYAYLSAESSAQTGKWTCLPYQRGMLDAITNPQIEKISIMKSARVGYTKMINHAIAYHIVQDPCPLMVVQPTIEDAQGYSKDEIAPMLRDTPCLYGLVVDPKSKDSSNTILKKIFPGGQLLMVGANSPRGFRGKSIRKVFFDEVDGYPASAGTEGDQIKLGTKRTDYFWNRQIILGSTPTTKQASRIEDSYEQSDKRRYYVPCPHCKHMQTLKWSGIDFTDKGSIKKPVYVCENCQKAITYDYHRWMIENGEWIAEKEFNGHAGFHIWAAYSYSPNATWAKIVQEFLESKDDTEKLKTWVNTVLGETWEEEGEQVDDNRLLDQRQTYNKIPSGVGVQVAAIDVQDDRLEILRIGVGEYNEIWALEHRIIYGTIDKPDVVKDLDDYLLAEYDHENGRKMKIQCTCIDTGGHYTNETYTYIKPRQRFRIFGVKGIGHTGNVSKAFVSRPSDSNIGKVKLFTVDANIGKDMLFSRLKNELKEDQSVNPSCIHFNFLFDEEFFSQLGAEKKIYKKKKGFVYREYKQVKERNEAIDLFVYAFAAFEILGIRNIKSRIDALKIEKQEQKVVEKSVKYDPITERKEAKSKPIRHKSWVKGWKN